jgi:dTDP-4-dehydrorhamnose reductase
MMMERDFLITGASSYVGARLYYDLSKGFNVVGTYNNKQLSEEFARLDITNPNDVFETVKNYRPRIIIHAAANASSKSCEADPANAINVNEKGTENIVNAANHFSSVLVYLSSTVTDLKSNLYERTKSAGESASTKTKAGFVILKPCVIYGMSPNTTTDKPFNQILRNTQGQGPLSYDNSWHFQPTWIGHISEIIAKIAEENMRNEEITIVVPEMRSKFEIASDILRKFEIEPVKSGEKSSRPSEPSSTDSMKRLNLPVYGYEEIKEKIVEEIKRKDKYVI